MGNGVHERKHVFRPPYTPVVAHEHGVTRGEAAARQVPPSLSAVRTATVHELSCARGGGAVGRRSRRDGRGAEEQHLASVWRAKPLVQPSMPGGGCSNVGLAGWLAASAREATVAVQTGAWAAPMVAHHKVFGDAHKECR